jgi:hypothetical protein
MTVLLTDKLTEPVSASEFTVCVIELEVAALKSVFPAQPAVMVCGLPEVLYQLDC